MAEACIALQSLAKALYFMSDCNSIIIIKRKMFNNASECFTLVSFSYCLLWHIAWLAAIHSKTSFPWIW